MRKTWVMVLALAVSAGAAQAADVVAQRKVADNWPEFELNWRGGSGSKGALYRLAPFHENGKMLICGAVQYLDTGNYRQTRSVLRGATLTVNGRVVVKNFSFMNRIKKNEPLIGAQANCVATGADYPRKFDEFRVDYDNRPRRF
ncbi:hypothetical protein [Actibacterium ureilyticum]|uniref:hypothetical protein n=1 Tax=Actibacterium ureilyticum TaxID=1590614 RepID=UPI001140FFFE|nr:hypothetical protein [Actibacterium ureilyticum]